jgi:hypothetical protein
MQIINEIAFRQWLAVGSIYPTPEVGEIDTISFSQSSATSGIWFPSMIPSKLPGFIAAALQAISPHGRYYLLRRGGGKWQEGNLDGPISNRIIDDVLQLYGVHSTATGALCFLESDWKQLTAIIAAFYVHGWSVGEEVYILAEERDAILRTSHHGELLGQFPSAKHFDQFVSAMERAGYGLGKLLR